MNEMIPLVLAHGPVGLFDYFPVLFLVAAVFVIRAAMKDAPKSAPKDALKDAPDRASSVRRLPTNHVSFQTHAAMRRQHRKSHGGFTGGVRGGSTSGRGETRSDLPSEE